MPELKIIDSAVLISSSDLDNTLRGETERGKKRKMKGKNKILIYNAIQNIIIVCMKATVVHWIFLLPYIISMHFSITTGSADVLVSMLRMSYFLLRE